MTDEFKNFIIKFISHRCEKMGLSEENSKTVSDLIISQDELYDLLCENIDEFIGTVNQFVSLTADGDNSSTSNDILNKSIVDLIEYFEPKFGLEAAVKQAVIFREEKMGRIYPSEGDPEYNKSISDKIDEIITAITNYRNSVS